MRFLVPALYAFSSVRVLADPSPEPYLPALNTPAVGACFGQSHTVLNRPALRS